MSFFMILQTLGSCHEKLETRSLGIACHQFTGHRPRHPACALPGQQFFGADLGGTPVLVQHLAFVPDGQILATGGGLAHNTGDVKLWDLATGQERVGSRLRWQGTPGRSIPDQSLEKERVPRLIIAGARRHLRSRIRMLQQCAES
jgi:hypothetical protein